MELRAKTARELEKAGRKDYRLCQCCGEWFSPDPGVDAFCCVCVGTDEALADADARDGQRETLARIEDIDRALDEMQAEGVGIKHVLYVERMRAMLANLQTALVAGTFEVVNPPWPAEVVASSTAGQDGDAFAIMSLVGPYSPANSVVRLYLLGNVVADYRWVTLGDSGYGELRYSRNEAVLKIERHVSTKHAALSVQDMVELQSELDVMGEDCDA